MEELINTLLPFVPEEHRSKVAALIILSPYITRAYYALINGRGLRGIMSSIWLGTNTPKSYGNFPEIKPEPQANAPRTTDNGPQPASQPPTSNPPTS